MFKIDKTEDMNIIKQLHENVFNEVFDIDHYLSKSKTKKITNYLLYNDNVLVGFCLVFDKVNKIHLWIGGILQQYRKMGYWSKFFDEIIAYSREKNYKEVTMSTYNHRPDILRLAIKKGFKIVGTEEGIYGDRVKICLMHPIINNEDIRISLTNYCNFKCFFCHNEGINSSKLNILEKEKLEMLLNQCNLNNCKSITLTGGEPLTNTEMIKYVIDYCNNIRYYPSIKVITNASLLNEDIINILKSYNGKLKLNISLHSITEEVFDSITNTRNQFKKTINGIDMLNKYNLDFRLNYVVLKGINNSMDDFNNLIKWCTDKKIKKITFLELLVTNENKSILKYFTDYENIKTTIEILGNNIGDLHIEFESDKKIRYILKTNENNIVIEVFKLTCRLDCSNCSEIKDRTIGPDGEYYPCFIRGNEKCGNVCENMREAFYEGNMLIRHYADENSKMKVTC